MVAALLLVLIAPVLAAVAVAVVVSSPGPALFRQRRVGKGGISFDILKFRTMCRDAENVLVLDPSLASAHAASGYKLALHADPRITGAGRWLRRFDLDELPQLWNVVKGDMSLVGPRPVPEAELACYGASRLCYEAVRPGVTGLWQVSGRNRLAYPERVALDAAYVARRSLCTDLAILARTLPAMVRGGGTPFSLAHPGPRPTVVTAGFAPDDQAVEPQHNEMGV